MKVQTRVACALFWRPILGHMKLAKPNRTDLSSVVATAKPARRGGCRRAGSYDSEAPRHSEAATTRQNYSK